MSDNEEAAAEVAENEPAIIGEFGSFDEVREFQAAESGEVQPGDIAIVNGALIRFTEKGTEVLCSDLMDYFAPPADHTEEFARSLAEIERVVLNAEFESGRLLINMRDLLLGMFKAKPKKWSEMSEQEMRDLGKQLESQASTIIKKICHVVAEGEEISVAGKLDKYSNSGSFSLSISAANDEDAALALYRMQGHDVIIMSADAKRFLDSNEVEVIPDQASMQFADGERAEGEDAAEAAEHAEAEEAEEHDDVEEAAEAAAVEEQQQEQLEEQAPAAEPDAAEPEAEAAAETKTEARADEFEEATAEELAGQKGRAPNVEAERKADYTGAKEPTEAVPGESWHSTADDKVRYMHPNGKWYISAPTEADLEKFRAGLDEERAETQEDAESGFPAKPA